MAARVRLERRAHPLDHLDPAAAGRTIDSLAGLDPESWTAAGAASPTSSRPQAASVRRAARGAGPGLPGLVPRSLPGPEPRAQAREYARAREFFLRAGRSRTHRSRPSTCRSKASKVAVLPDEACRRRGVLLWRWSGPASTRGRRRCTCGWGRCSVPAASRCCSSTCPAWASRRCSPGRRRASVDADLRVAADTRRSGRRPLRRDRRLVRRLLGDEARLHPPRISGVRGQLGRRCAHHLHARVAAQVA